MFELENYETLLTADARNFLKGEYPDHYDMTVGRIGYVKNDIDTIRKSFISLGFHLHELDMCAEYIRCGYTDFYVFCEDVFHLSRSSVHRYIAVWKKFCEYEKSQPKMWIADKYKDFNFSQLVEMLNMPHPEVAKPDMSVIDLRELKKRQINAKKGISNEPDLGKALDQLDKIIKSSKAQNENTTPALPASMVPEETDVCDVAQVEESVSASPVICRYDNTYFCVIEDVVRNHFTKNGCVTGCVGCCKVCLNRHTCEYRCDYIAQTYPCIEESSAVLPAPSVLEYTSNLGPVDVCDVAQAPEEPQVEYEHNFSRLDFPNGNVLISDINLPESFKKGLCDYLTSLKIDYISSDADVSSVCNMINQLQDFIMSL